MGTVNVQHAQRIRSFLSGMLLTANPQYERPKGSGRGYPPQDGRGTFATGAGGMA